MVRFQKQFYEEYWQYRKKIGYIYGKKHIPRPFAIIASLVGSGKKVLDVGCGEGFLAKFLMEKGNKVWGIDISEQAVELARRNGVNAFVCDIENEDLPIKETFDVIILSEVIEHLITPKKVLKKLKRYLADEGYFIITFPNIAYYKYRLQLLFGRFPRQHLYERSEHLHYWSIPDFMEFLRSCDLKAVEIRPVFQFPFHNIVSKIMPLRKLLEKFPNLFGYQIVVIAKPINEVKKSVTKRVEEKIQSSGSCLTVLGLGYVGLPTAVVFASKGFRVIGVDIDKNKVAAVNSCKCYIKESGLDALLQDVVSKGVLRATTDAVEAIKQCNTVIIAVPTPVKEGAVDLSYLRDALESVKAGLHRDMLVVIESTIPPGTTVSFAKPLLEESELRAEEDFYLAHVPERIAPGKAIHELLHEPRVVGGVGPRSTMKALELYSKVNPNLYPTDAITAEFVKLIENTFRDLNIAYANLIALMAERLGIDVYEAIGLANTHPRVNIHMPGAGVGGPCLTKDPYMLASLYKEFWGTQLIILARKINEYMPRHTVEIVERALRDSGLSVEGAKIAVLGVAYKGGVDDTRESPAKYIVRELLGRGAGVVVYDPYTEECFGAERADSLEDAVKNADVVVIVTDHPEFKGLNLETIAKLVRYKIIVDGRRVVEPHQAVKYSFRYYGIGYGKVFKL